MRNLTLTLCLFLSVFSSATFAASAIDTFEFESIEQEQVFHDLTKVLRCPKCQNQNISDSNAELAKDLRNKTYELVKEGKTQDEVVDYMVARFGNFVRYDPPITPATIFLWLGPLLFILFGFLVLYKQAKNKNRKEDELDSNEAIRLKKILKQETK
ncbi:cytochrome c-type biogenesis protein [Psychromonas sp. Urea-02u-13]|uniref:cytochrome c-type biogenesis protein n=1 Tax=Psychromonas sp. Urea-02u-13 TaxID=2058326 RepID=UPI000C34AD3A|nr:cytochrome c-type biogenesis protein [Psychromonas sp. Urea-02u-13]PKG39882.1 cytochrome c-type biogenesis protein CcmH [Psychromonas sp. Urea-02u-13]